MSLSRPLRPWRAIFTDSTGERRVLGRFDAKPGHASEIALMLWPAQVRSGRVVLERDEAREVSEEAVTTTT